MNELWYDGDKVVEIQEAVQEVLEQFEGKVEKELALRQVNCKEFTEGDTE